MLRDDDEDGAKLVGGAGEVGVGNDWDDCCMAGAAGTTRSGSCREVGFGFVGSKGCSPVCSRSGCSRETVAACGAVSGGGVNVSTLLASGPAAGAPD